MTDLKTRQTPAATSGTIDPTQINYLHDNFLVENTDYAADFQRRQNKLATEHDQEAGDALLEEGIEQIKKEMVIEYTKRDPQVADKKGTIADGTEDGRQEQPVTDVVVELPASETIKELNESIQKNENVRAMIFFWENAIKESEPNLVPEYHRKNFEKNKTYTKLYNELIGSDNDAEHAQKMAFYYNEVVTPLTSQAKADSTEKATPTAEPTTQIQDSATTPRKNTTTISPASPAIELQPILTQDTPEKVEEEPASTEIKKPKTNKLVVRKADLAMDSKAAEEQLQKKIDIIRNKTKVLMNEYNVFLGITSGIKENQINQYPHQLDSKGIQIAGIVRSLTIGLPDPDLKSRTELRTFNLKKPHEQARSTKDLPEATAAMAEIAKKYAPGKELLEKEKVSPQSQLDELNKKHKKTTDLDVIQEKRRLEQILNNIDNQIEKLDHQERDERNEWYKIEEPKIKKKQEDMTNKLENFDFWPNTKDTWNFFYNELPKYIDEVVDDSSKTTKEKLYQRVDEQTKEKIEELRSKLRDPQDKKNGPDPLLGEIAAVRAVEAAEKRKIDKILLEAASIQKFYLKLSCIMGIFSTPGRYLHRTAHELLLHGKYPEYLKPEKNVMAPHLNSIIDTMGPTLAKLIGLVGYLSVPTTGVIKQNADYISSLCQYYAVEKTSRLELQLPLTQEERQQKEETLRMASERLKPSRVGLMAFVISQTAGRLLPGLLEAFTPLTQLAENLRYLDPIGTVSKLTGLGHGNIPIGWIAEGTGVYGTQAVIAKVSKAQNKEAQDKEIAKIFGKKGATETAPSTAASSAFFSAKGGKGEDQPTPTTTVASSVKEAEKEPLKP